MWKSDKGGVAFRLSSTNASVAAEGKGYATMRRRTSYPVVEPREVQYATLEQ